MYRVTYCFCLFVTIIATIGELSVASVVEKKCDDDRKVNATSLQCPGLYIKRNDRSQTYVRDATKDTCKAEVREPRDSEKTSSNGPQRPCQCSIGFKSLTPYIGKRKKLFLAFSWTFKQQLNVSSFYLEVDVEGYLHHNVLSYNLTNVKEEYVNFLVIFNNLRVQVNTPYTVRVYSLPYSDYNDVSPQMCEADTKIFSNGGRLNNKKKHCCMKDTHIGKSQECKRFKKECPSESTKTPTMNATTTTTTTAAAEIPVERVHSLKTHHVISVVMVVFLVIIGIFFLACSLMTRTTAKRAVVLVSTGDNQSKYQDIANEVASQLKECGKYDRVYFSGWQMHSASSYCNSDMERLHEAIDGCSVALLISSPFGKRSYEELLVRQEASTWRDAFVIGSYALLTKRFPFQFERKVIVAYAAEKGENAADFVHKSFRLKNSRAYNLLKPSDRQALYKRLFGKNLTFEAVRSEPLIQNREMIY